MPIITLESPGAQAFDVRAAVDAERDRRVRLGFEFEGKHYQTRNQSDRENILAIKSDALAAVLMGAKVGDYRWANAEKDFFWIAGDNERVLMDAQTALAFGQAATQRKNQLIVAGSDLKEMDPIPLDYAADKYWEGVSAEEEAPQVPKDEAGSTTVEPTTSTSSKAV